MERYDPFGRMISLRQMVDRLLEDAFIAPGSSARRPAVNAGSLAMNVYESGDSLVVEASLPGIKPEDVEINIDHGILTIRAELKSEQERQERNYLIREHQAGHFTRSLQLPDTVDSSAAQASYEHGVLRLTLPKSEHAKPRRIPIQTSTQSGKPPAMVQPSESSRYAVSETSQPVDSGASPGSSQQTASTAAAQGQSPDPPSPPAAG